MQDDLTFAQKKTDVQCYHCGDACREDAVRFDGKAFCCPGCRFVYELLSENDLCTYYDLTQTPGISPAEAGGAVKYSYLEDEQTRRNLIHFSDGQLATSTFYIPAMHCSSCVWLLENLYKLNPLIRQSKVDFLKKEVMVTFVDTPASLRQVVELLAGVGYEPELNLESLGGKKKSESNRDLYIKIGVAGFCFVNIMLLSLPEYLAWQDQVESSLKKFFSFLNIALSLPVLFYSAADYFRSALHGWKQRMINMDVPISIGVLALFSRSLYEILTASGSGYMDSFTGLVFFLLIGKLFEKKTYDTLSFDRDYRSYFPVSVTKKIPDGETTVSLNNLKVKDRILIRNGELIPADSVLIRGRAMIDYSFVTGESQPVEKHSGDLVYAGGRQVGEMLELDVVKPVDQSYLTDLWNDTAFTKSHVSRVTSLANRVSRYFTAVVLSIAAGGASYWALYNPALAWNAFTAVLIIACPCALALSTPFTLGNTLRIFGKNGFYLKNTSVIETLAAVSDIVFDKTGTITYGRSGTALFKPWRNQPDLTTEEKQGIKSLTRHSAHPLSRQIHDSITQNEIALPQEIREQAGLGLEGRIRDRLIRLGSAAWCGWAESESGPADLSRVYFSVDGTRRGWFELGSSERRGLTELVKNLRGRFRLTLLSGDIPAARERMHAIFGDRSELRFEQTPVDKLLFVKEKQRRGGKVLMIGDGLNDAGALKQSDAGISITEDINTFTPASDAILSAQQFEKFPVFLEFSRNSMGIIAISFVISFLYNLIGITIAVQGMLSPLVSAVLMPISSISVVLFTTGMTNFFARKMGLKILGG